MYPLTVRNTLNPNYGTENDLMALSKALHDRGMYFMVDVVANHMGYNGAGQAVDYSQFTPFNSASYFHRYCSIDNYNNQTDVEDCWLGDSTVSLPDLDTTLKSVQTLWYDWVSNLVKKYKIDGLRIDTVKHVQKSFWPGFNDAAGVYCIGEVFDGDPHYTCPYQNVLDGVLNYPLYYPLLRAFESPSSKKMGDLYSMISQISTDCADPTLLGNFIENHDNPRFASLTSDLALAKNTLAFMFLADGIPIVYAGQEQHYNGGDNPANREATWLSGYETSAPLYSFITETNAIRTMLVKQSKTWATTINKPFYKDATTIAMKKGGAVTVLSNLGALSSSYTLTLGGTGYAQGTELVELYTCKSVTVGSAGISVSMVGGLPRVLVPASWATKSKFCSAKTAAAPTTVKATTKTAKQGSKTTVTAKTTTTKTATSTSSTCAKATALSVRFSESVVTTWGENVFLAGSISQLGSWNPDKAVALSSNKYTSANPLWEVTVSLPVGTTFQYKFIKKEKNGKIVWEADPNRSYTVPSGCAGSTVTVSLDWQSKATVTTSTTSTAKKTTVTTPATKTATKAKTTITKTTAKATPTEKTTRAKTSTKSTKAPTTKTTTTACVKATALSVKFDESVVTKWGENVFLAGSIPQLGSWDTGKAVALSASDYTSANPLWKATVSLPVGTTFQYKFIKKEPDGKIVWESDPNRSYTVPTGCAGSTVTVSSNWK